MITKDGSHKIGVMDLVSKNKRWVMDLVSKNKRGVMDLVSILSFIGYLPRTA